jgi:hypothetical protein
MPDDPTDIPPGAYVLSFTRELLEAGVTLAGRGGDRGTHRQYVQFVDGRPGIQTAAQVAAPCAFTAGSGGVGTETLSRMPAREWLKRQLSLAGFDGLAGFVCVATSSGKPLLWVEAFDAATGASHVAHVEVKRTFSGKYRQTGSFTLGGAADPL